MKAVAVVSGGMDSVTLAHYLHSFGVELHILSFNYGQKHSKELVYAETCAEQLGAEFDVIDVSSLGSLLGNSALTGNIDIPEGHYDDNNIGVTVVPNRNAIMISIGYGVAVAGEANCVAVGIHAGDHPVYPDCRPEFASSIEETLQIATESNIWLYTPFVHLTKAQIVRLGDVLGVDYGQTWTCYKGGEIHCGVCSTCVERKEAFRLASIEDPTEYKG